MKKRNHVENYVAYLSDDYTQSANTLFHFMKEAEYLKQMLISKVIKPRYCTEDIEYLGIENNGIKWKQIAVLQKCFCDTPLHKLTQNFILEGVGKEFEALSDEDKFIIKNNNTHPSLYGDFGIAFSKSWGEEKKLQPVHYLNENSDFSMEYSSLFNKLLTEENILEECADDILNRLAFVKPLRGTMNRPHITKSNERVTVSVKKNFHDEKEWRYVPKLAILESLKLSNVIPNQTVIKTRFLIDELNRSMENEEYRSIWLDYKYEDIRYIIVPSFDARLDLIRTIMKLNKENFESKRNLSEQKYILISKILVLDEIRKDL